MNENEGEEFFALIIEGEKFLNENEGEEFLAPIIEGEKFF